MANRALLLALDSTDPPWDHDGRYFRDALLGANYQVPLLWLSLFDADGLVTWPGIHDGSPFTALIQPRGECVERSRTRLKDWSHRWPQVFGDLSGPWLGYAGTVRDAYLERLGVTTCIAAVSGAGHHLCVTYQQLGKVDLGDPRPHRPSQFGPYGT